MSMNLAAELLRHGSPRGVAISYGDDDVTYTCLRQIVERVARILHSRHRIQDRIGIVSENNPFFVACYLGILRARMIAVPFPTDSPPDIAAHMARDAGVGEIWVSSRQEARVRVWARDGGCDVVLETVLREVDERQALPPLI